MEGIQKGYLFCQKWYVKGKESDLGAEPSRIKFCLVRTRGDIVGGSGRAYNFICHVKFVKSQQVNHL